MEAESNCWPEHEAHEGLNARAQAGGRHMTGKGGGKMSGAAHAEELTVGS